MITDKPYAGGCKEMNHTFPGFEATRSHESGEEPPVKLQKRRVVNSYVITKRSYGAIWQEARRIDHEKLFGTTNGN
jgi:hypothetical protein